MVSVMGYTVLPYGAPQLGTFKIPGSTVSLTARREIAPLLVGFARDFHAEVEELVPGWCWGHSPRLIRGSTKISRHAWGGAWDLNAPRHPMGKRNTFSPGERKAIDKILNRYTYQGRRLLRHGKDYVSRPDDMHVEVNVDRKTALAAVKLLQAPVKKPAKPKPVAHPAGSRKLRQALPVMTGDDVGFVQRWIGPARCGPADEDYGPRTVAGVRWWQATQKLKITGEMGSADWSRMLGRTVRV